MDIDKLKELVEEYGLLEGFKELSNEEDVRLSIQGLNNGISLFATTTSSIIKDVRREIIKELNKVRKEIRVEARET